MHNKDGNPGKDIYNYRTLVKGDHRTYFLFDSAHLIAVVNSKNICILTFFCESFF